MTIVTVGGTTQLADGARRYDIGIRRRQSGSAMRDAESRLAEAVYGVLMSAALLVAAFLASSPF